MPEDQQHPCAWRCRGPEAQLARVLLDVAAASAISVLVGPYSAYSQSTWGPYGTMEEDITRLVLGDLPTIILSSWGAHGQSTFSTVRRHNALVDFQETFLLLPPVRIPGHPAMVPSLTSGDSTTEKRCVWRHFCSSLWSENNSGYGHSKLWLCLWGIFVTCGKQKYRTTDPLFLLVQDADLSN